MSEKQFHGEGYSREDFSPDERARHRHMYSELDRNFREMDEKTFEAITKSAVLVTAAQIIASIIKVGGPIAISGLAMGAYAKAQGWI